MVKSFWMKDQKGNFSNEKNDSFDESNKYIGIRIQQGVPLLDRDWNELEDLRRYQEYILAKYYIGNCSPDGGFVIVFLNDYKDFMISKGRFLVQGIEVTNEEDNLTYSVLRKRFPDLEEFKLPPKEGDMIYIYLEAWISEVEGPDNKDVGIKTCYRHKVEWVVRFRSDVNLSLKKFHYYANLATIKIEKGKPKSNNLVALPLWISTMGLETYDDFIEREFGVQKESN
jgi:hypothetical protein